jgi:UDP-2,3-diacylglucosamine hydrolase
LQKEFYNYFIFGHRHLAIDYLLPPLTPCPFPRSGEGGEARYINLGDWIHYYTYAVFDGGQLTLRSYKGKDDKIIRN